MRYQADLHTHTVASGHARNTIEEMVDAARRKELSMLALTEHSVKMAGTCPESYFWDTVSWQDKVWEGIDVLFGVELNIIDYQGTVDMSEELLAKMAVGIASIHADGICYKNGTVEENTNAVIGAIRNPYVNVIGHLDDSNIPVDYQKVVSEAVKNETLLEINNNSLTPGCWRREPEKNLKTILKLCRQYQYPIVIDSDAHCVENVGRHEEAVRLLEAEDFPKELVLNYYPEQLRSFLNKYRIHKEKY